MTIVFKSGKTMKASKEVVKEIGDWLVASKGFKFICFQNKEKNGYDAIINLSDISHIKP